MTDKQLKALAKLGKTKGGRQILRDHGAAIISLTFGPRR